jgi:hypothetical protein
MHRDYDGFPERCIEMSPLFRFTHAAVAAANERIDHHRPVFKILGEPGVRAQ